MRVSKLHIKNFKRFSQVQVGEIPPNTKLVIIVGPNGSGKSSLFDAFHQWFRGNVGFGYGGDEAYYRKDTSKAYSVGESVTVEFHDHVQGARLDKKSMYFRTAYRNDPDFSIRAFSRLGAPQDNMKVGRLIDNDQTVSENYQRLVLKTMSGVYARANDDKSVRQLREELIGKVRESMQNVFDDLVLNDIGDPLEDGSFKFDKGEIESFHYKNLSGGEKAAFDLLLDLLIKLEHYDNTVFFIDEPDSHMQTSLQGKLIKEIFRLIPDNSQIWITTHSLGVMRMGKELSRQGDPGGVVFIDFNDVDFDGEVELGPASIDGLMWEKFLSVALGDLAIELSPEHLVIVEGSIDGVRRKNFDSTLYRKVFENKYPNLIFVSGGSSLEIENPRHAGFELLSVVLENTNLTRLIDRDDKSDEEVAELEAQRIFVTSRRHLESYLFDDELITKLVNTNFDPSLVEGEQADSLSDDEKLDLLLEQAMRIKEDAIASSVARGNPVDDVKSASGDIYIGLKRLLRLTKCGNNTEAFMRDAMSKLLSEDTQVYQEMEEQIALRLINA